MAPADADTRAASMARASECGSGLVDSDSADPGRLYSSKVELEVLRHERVCESRTCLRGDASSAAVAASSAALDANRAASFSADGKRSS